MEALLFASASITTPNIPVTEDDVKDIVSNIRFLFISQSGCPFNKKERPPFGDLSVLVIRLFDVAPLLQRKQGDQIAGVIKVKDIVHGGLHGACAHGRTGVGIAENVLRLRHSLISPFY